MWLPSLSFDLFIKLIWRARREAGQCEFSKFSRNRRPIRLAFVARGATWAVEQPRGYPRRVAAELQLSATASTDNSIDRRACLRWSLRGGRARRQPDRRRQTPAERNKWMQLAPLGQPANEPTSKAGHSPAVGGAASGLVGATPAARGARRGRH